MPPIRPAVTYSLKTGGSHVRLQSLRMPLFALVVISASCGGESGDEFGVDVDLDSLRRGTVVAGDVVIVFEACSQESAGATWPFVLTNTGDEAHEYALTAKMADGRRNTEISSHTVQVGLVAPGSSTAGSFLMYVKKNEFFSDGVAWGQQCRFISVAEDPQ